MKIIHPLLDRDGKLVEGAISVIHPDPRCEIPLEELARKDVPVGLPYLIVEDADVPQDRTFRAAWTADFSEPHGEGIGPEAWHAEQAEIRAEIEALAALQSEGPET